ncbi:MAG: M23 family metallopeptidase, partial [Alphaproteobacteria bacterium]|nr:M23 family metallopeptidase [Alphaproteobacteria bacterium]
QTYPNMLSEQPNNEPSLQTPATQTIAQISLNNCSPNRVVRMTDIPGNSPIVGDIRVTSDFGPRKAPIAGATSWHKGIDISVPTGTPVYATANGTVEYIADQGNKDGGKYILIKHGDSRFRTAYFHLSDNNILKVGDTVRAGDLIGKSGNTGNSTGPHLDYRIFYTAPNKSFGWGADAIDPLWVKNYLETQYRFASQSVKSCLHNKNNFCAGQSSVKQTPPETLPCEIK